MERLGFRHLAVAMPQGELAGRVTTRNLLRHRATTTIVLGDEIDSAGRRRGAGAGVVEAAGLAASLLADAVDPRTIATVISAEICVLTRRAAELAEVRLAEAGKGRAAGALCGAGAGLGRSRRIPARCRPGQRHRLRDGRARRTRGPLVRGARHRDRRHTRRGRRAVLQGRRDGAQRAVAHERRTLEDHHRRLGAPPAAARTCSTSISFSTACRCTARWRWARDLDYAYDVGRQNPPFSSC